MTTIATKYPFVGCIETKQGGRDENQDNAGFVDTPLGLLLVVCDGMGGGSGGRTASLMAVDTILTVLSDVSEHTHRKDALKFGIEKANDLIYAKAKETPELRGMGTTIAALLINETSAYIAHAGDTRVYQLRKGAIVFRSADHSVVANLVRQKVISEEEARNHPQSNIITRALGIRPTVEIEFDEVSFLRGDRFVICSDGIWGMMSQSDLVKSMSTVMGISELTTFIAEEIDRIGQEKGGGHDNLTLAILDTSFDSEQKGDKKTYLAEDENTLTTKRIGITNRKWVTRAIFAIIFFSFGGGIICNLLLHKKKNDNFIQIENKYEEFNQTLQVQPLVREDEEVAEESQNIFLTNNIEELINDSIIRIEYDKAVSKKITNIVRNLDNLKSIHGKDKQTTKEIKRYYINSVIKPDVDSLLNIIVEDKRPFIIQILRMLDDEKIVSNNVKRGKNKSESIEYIDEIKNIIKKINSPKD